MNDGRLEELIDYVQDYYDYAAPSLKHNSQSAVSEKDGSSYATIAKHAASWFRKRANYVYARLNFYDIDEEQTPVEVQPIIIDTEDGIAGIRDTMADHGWYDLQGRPMANGKWLNGKSSRGIYITPAGRKVLVE
jgi:hypothetical protein